MQQDVARRCQATGAAVGKPSWPGEDWAFYGNWAASDAELKHQHAEEMFLTFITMYEIKLILGTMFSLDHLEFKNKILWIGLYLEDCEALFSNYKW